ncbi:MAG: carboxy-S-adenosyl-L-methionine synthase CmoA [Campylobacteraceae bacterium]
MQDKVFKKPIEKQFEFDEAVASVFDDMLDRSIPFYAEVLALVCDLSLKYVKENSSVLDLGCSTANTLLGIFKKSPYKLNLVGVDNSTAMLERAGQKIKAYGANIKLINDDITKVDFGKNSVVIANYMFQFIRPPKRLELVKKIYESLEIGGVCIFSEKIIYEDKKLNKDIIDLYLEFKKRQGYSEFEISQKREALENVLVPYSENENKELMKNASFKSVEVIFKWGNFATFVAMK